MSMSDLDAANDAKYLGDGARTRVTWTPEAVMVGSAPACTADTVLTVQGRWITTTCLSLFCLMIAGRSNPNGAGGEARPAKLVANCRGTYQCVRAFESARWFNQLDPNLNKRPFSEEEDRVVRDQSAGRAREQVGCHLKAPAGQVRRKLDRLRQAASNGFAKLTACCNRHPKDSCGTDNCIKNHWNSKLRKKRGLPPDHGEGDDDDEPVHKRLKDRAYDSSESADNSSNEDGNSENAAPQSRGVITVPRSHARPPAIYFVPVLELKTRGNLRKRHVGC
eukprot:1196078-Prorocentrum_minimum.AAC.10